MIRNLTGLLAALGYALEWFARATRDGRTPPSVDPARPAAVVEEEADNSELVLIAEIFERLSDRYLDEVRGWDALSGVLLGAIFALFVLFVDKVESFTWAPAALLSIPALLTVLNLRGGIEYYSPDPDLFEEAYVEDSSNALANLIASYKRDASENGLLRNRKRSGFYRALAVVALVGLVAVAGKEYTLLGSFHETNQTRPQSSRPPAGRPGDRRQRTVRREHRFCAAPAQGESHALEASELQFQPLRGPSSCPRQGKKVARQRY